MSYEMYWGLIITGIIAGALALGAGVLIWQKRKAVAIETPVALTRESGGEFVAMEALMSFTELTAEQQQIVAEYVRQQRATVGEFARLLNHMAALDSMYDGQVVAAWAAMLDSDLIVDGSGLAGVSTLTKAEVASIAAAMQVIIDTYNGAALRQLYVKMAGLTNTLG